MYLSTLFLSEIDQGVEHAITKCNEEFLRRFGRVKDSISAFFITDSSGKPVQTNCQCDEVMALWDVFKDYKDEVFLDLFIIKVMNSIRTVREGLKQAV